MSPFAGYSNFNECVSKNQDKNNPEAYCGSIKAEVEKGMTTKERGRNILAGLDRLLGKGLINPPGPPPRPGLKWRSETSRWVKDPSYDSSAPEPAPAVRESDEERWARHAAERERTGEPDPMEEYRRQQAARPTDVRGVVSDWASEAAADALDSGMGLDVDGVLSEDNPGHDHFWSAVGEAAGMGAGADIDEIKNVHYEKVREQVVAEFGKAGGGIDLATKKRTLKGLDRLMKVDPFRGAPGSGPPGPPPRPGLEWNDQSYRWTKPKQGGRAAPEGSMPGERGEVAARGEAAGQSIGVPNPKAMADTTTEFMESGMQDLAEQHGGLEDWDAEDIISKVVGTGNPHAEEFWRQVGEDMGMGPSASPYDVMDAHYDAVERHLLEAAGQAGNMRLMRKARGRRILRSLDNMTKECE